MPSITAQCGSLDIVGDVHGCLEELLELMAVLGYRASRQNGGFAVTPPPGRKLAFAGDLVNRGPATVEVLRLAMSMMRAGQALCVAGNHDLSLLKAMSDGTNATAPFLAQSIEQLGHETNMFRIQAAVFLAELPIYSLFDGGKLAIAHAGLKEWMLGRSTAEVSRFALQGESTGERDEFGVPIRSNWAADYHGKTLVVYGHSPVAEPLWQNNTVNIDTGCVYGGRLTALRYPELETVSVFARAIHHKSRRQFPVNEWLAEQK
ncbi:MAG: metallophosphoesterase [Terracidiphilus sp.]|nr:metallophosphoesterase [Terracidiphilus sp.]